MNGRVDHNDGILILLHYPEPFYTGERFINGMITIFKALSFLPSPAIYRLQRNSKSFSGHLRLQSLYSSVELAQRAALGLVHTLQDSRESFRWTAWHPAMSRLKPLRFYAPCSIWYSAFIPKPQHLGSNPRNVSSEVHVLQSGLLPGKCL